MATLFVPFWASTSALHFSPEGVVPVTSVSASQPYARPASTAICFKERCSSVSGAVTQSPFLLWAKKCVPTMRFLGDYLPGATGHPEITCTFILRFECPPLVSGQVGSIDTVVHKGVNASKWHSVAPSSPAPQRCCCRPSSQLLSACSDRPAQLRSLSGGLGR